MDAVKGVTTNTRFLTHLLFWLFAYLLLTYIYGTAYNSFALGAAVIAILLPVHIAYYYLLTYFVLPELFRGRYVRVIIKGLLAMAAIAILYRLTEIFITDPYIFRFYKQKNPDFTWTKLNAGFWQRLSHQGDFVNAVERSNVVVWIGITMKLFAMWHERRHTVLQAELTTLKGQLHPHFLFNSLNNLYALSLNNAPQTPEIILGLSNILRYVIYECNADRVSLQKDVEILQDYIKLEKLRYEDRLDLNLDIEPQLHSWQTTPLLMLPLIENAFKHGVGETVDSPWINIEIRVQQKSLILKISNSKPLLSTTKQTKEDSHIGLANVQNRLRLLYPGSHKLEWHDEEDCFILEMVVPLHSKEQV